MNTYLNTRFQYSIGIDLSLTNIRMGVFHHKKIEIIPISTNQKSMPFYISFTNDGVLFGDDAKAQSFINPTNTIYDILFLLDRKYSDPEFQNEMKKWPFKIVGDMKDRPKIEVTINNQIKQFSPEEVLSMIFDYLKKIASSYLVPCNKYKKVRSAKVSVPCFLYEKLNEPIKKAAKMADLDECYTFGREIVSVFPIEDLHYKKIDEKANFLIIHIGGKFFNASIYNEICECSYDLNLSGDAFDERIANYFIDRFNKKINCDVNLSPYDMNKFKIECEKIKIKLSTENEASISYESFFNGHNLADNISRSTFERINNDMFTSMISHIDNALQKSNLKKEDISKIFLIGGSSKIPRIQKIIEEFFLSKFTLFENPEEKGVLGIAEWAYFLKNLNYRLIEVETLIIDNIKNSIGIGTSDGNYIIFIDKNDENYISNRQKYLFTTSKDYQTKVVINLYKGEMAKINENHFLCKFEFDGIKPELRGIPQIEVTIWICDFLNNVYIKTKVEDKKTGKYEKFIFGYNKLDKNDCVQTKLDSNELRLKNDVNKKELNAKLQLENLCFNARNFIINSKFESLIGKSEKEFIDNEINNILKWCDSQTNSTLLDFENKKQEIEIKFKKIFQNTDPNHLFQKIAFSGCLSDE